MENMYLIISLYHGESFISHRKEEEEVQGVKKKRRKERKTR